MKVAKAKESGSERRPFSREQARLIYTELTDDRSGLVRKASHKWVSVRSDRYPFHFQGSRSSTLVIL